MPQTLSVALLHRYNISSNCREFFEEAMSGFKCFIQDFYLLRTATLVSTLAADLRVHSLGDILLLEHKLCFFSIFDMVVPVYILTLKELK